VTQTLFLGRDPAPKIGADCFIGERSPVGDFKDFADHAPGVPLG
jgi:hypothetical protein